MFLHLMYSSIPPLKIFLHTFLFQTFVLQRVSLLIVVLLQIAIKNKCPKKTAIKYTLSNISFAVFSIILILRKIQASNLTVL